MELTESDLVQMHRLMLLTRCFEEKAVQWYATGKVLECPHSSMGQEAIGVGACYGLRRDDQVMPSLRTRSAFFARGASVRDVVATMAGRRNGYSGGRDTSHHAGIPELGIMAGVGIVGGSILPSVGAALAMRLQERDSVVVSFFGDGASNTGAFHEGLNFAGLYKLPIIFVCENNQWAQGTSRQESMAIDSIAVRAESYGFPGVSVDGNDVVVIHQSTQVAVQRARSGQGPTLIECQTFRWRPHAELLVMEKIWKGEAEEVERWRKRCPIQRLESSLMDTGALTSEEILRIKKEIEKEMEAAISFAEESPGPDPRDALAGVYAAGGARPAC